MPLSRRPSDRPISAGWDAAVVGFEFCASVGGLAVVGFLIDRWQNTTPVWTLVLTGLGFVGGSYNLFKEVRRMQRREVRRVIQKDSESVDMKAASAEVAAGRGKPRPTGRVNLFESTDVSVEDLEDVEIDWPDEERDQIGKQLRDAGDSLDLDEDSRR